MRTGKLYKRIKPLIFLFLSVGLLSGKTNSKVETQKSTTMKIEIWSDVVCPWCYIGKRRFEEALAEFPYKDRIEVEWKSFQLDPTAVTDTSISTKQRLAEKYGVTEERAQEMTDNVVQVAATVGLNYNLDNALTVNTINAHRFIHYAQTQGKQDRAKERLLKAHFVENKNVDHYPTLIELGKEIGLDENAVSEMLESGAFTKAVKADISEAQTLGIKGVPFFVLDRKYGISGAQESATILENLNKAFAEWVEKNPDNGLQIIDGKVCTPGGICE